MELTSAAVFPPDPSPRFLLVDSGDGFFSADRHPVGLAPDLPQHIVRGHRGHPCGTKTATLWRWLTDRYLFLDSAPRKEVA